MIPSSVQALSIFVEVRFRTIPKKAPVSRTGAFSVRKKTASAGGVIKLIGLL
jgi:hypothetical protein